MLITKKSKWWPVLSQIGDMGETEILLLTNSVQKTRRKFRFMPCLRLILCSSFFAWDLLRLQWSFLWQLQRPSVAWPPPICEPSTMHFAPMFPLFLFFQGRGNRRTCRSSTGLGRRNQIPESYYFTYNNVLVPKPKMPKAFLNTTFFPKKKYQQFSW